MSSSHDAVSHSFLPAWRKEQLLTSEAGYSEKQPYEVLLGVHRHLSPWRQPYGFGWTILIPRLERWVSGVCTERGHLLVGNPLRKTLYCYHTKCSPLVPSQAGDYASLPSAQNARRHPRRKWLLLNTDSDWGLCHLPPPPPGVRLLSALFHQQRAALCCAAWPCRKIEACLSPRNSQLYSWNLKYPKVLGEEQGVCSFPNHMDVNWVRH